MKQTDMFVQVHPKHIEVYLNGNLFGDIYKQDDGTCQFVINSSNRRWDMDKIKAIMELLKEVLVIMYDMDDTIPEDNT